MTAEEINDIADDARDLRNALMARAFGAAHAQQLTAAAMPAIVTQTKIRYATQESE